MAYVHSCSLIISHYYRVAENTAISDFKIHSFEEIQLVCDGIHIPVENNDNAIQN